MGKFNLLEHPEKLVRDVSSRLPNKEQNKIKALEFGEVYFDGERQQGYGGYYYDGRWVPIAERLKERYSLNNGSRFLDVGCAKGFLLHDLSSVCEGLEICGLDISEYAKAEAYGDTGRSITIGNCNNLPYDDDYFDASVAINTIHNLELDECKKAISELIRVTKNKKNIFIQVDAFSDQNELELFEAWVLTAKTYLKPKEWLDVFSEVGYEGDYFWTIIGFSE